VSDPAPMNTGPREWDAQTYDRVSDPQYEWGLEVLDRLELDGDEYVMDAGCGSGRVTACLLERLPNGHVLCVDASESMMAKATATFHWLPDHDLLFFRLHAALKPGGRLVAQCGGEGNVAKHAVAILTVASRPEFAPHFAEMEVMWNFAPADQTAERLRRAGFDDVSCWLEEKPVQPEDPYAFTTTVTMGPHLSRLPEELRRSFAEAVLELEDDPLILNYVRLNIEARRPE
jgi:trans-aconitate 2-methyltransferase